MSEDLLPRNSLEWRLRAIQHGVLNKTIFDIAPESTLDFERAVFLTLRIVCPKEKKLRHLKEENELYGWVTNKSLSRSRELLKNNRHWHEHLKSVVAPWRKDDDGAFGTAHNIRTLIREEESWGSCTQKIVFPPITDDVLDGLSRSSTERYASSALNGYLSALTMGYHEVKGKWAAFDSLSLDSAERKTVMLAKINGCLLQDVGWDIGDVTHLVGVFAIADAHNTRRRVLANTHLGIQMQEGAQFAAWIAEFPPDPAESDFEGLFRRLKISQNHTEVYFTIATFSMDYVDYICAKDVLPTPQTFLEMQEYGPLDTTNLDDAKFLGEFMLAFSIQGALMGKTREEAVKEMKEGLALLQTIRERRAWRGAVDQELLDSMSPTPTFREPPYKRPGSA